MSSHKCLMFGNKVTHCGDGSIGYVAMQLMIFPKEKAMFLLINESGFAAHHHVSEMVVRPRPLVLEVHSGASVTMSYPKLY